MVILETLASSSRPIWTQKDWVHCNLFNFRSIGVDLSLPKDDPSIACAALIVIDNTSLKVVYQDFNIVHLHIPYIPRFLTFIEVGFGLACHLEVLADLPTIGIGKNCGRIGSTVADVTPIIHTCSAMSEVATSPASD
ncbi:hypothetical protein GIB67_009734 [Kingdonia uniflora]|uniref:Uncharacterized protein n=1 Tax=Kingdonia uniflora TaxID=39325 RepID=A0A7J7LB56_9MAGN|nr:hypothetical protein GIB67_009734 [Kingdonia uniflora]